MASWLKHPRYLRHREGLVKHLQPPKYRFRLLNPVVFLCGAKKSEGRDAIRDYLHKFHPGISVFYAEKVWEVIAAFGETDALQMEAALAELAELVIVVVESAGTFTELGAFSISRELRKKLLPIVDEEHRNNDSFISNGPLKWIDKESDFRPTIYTKLTEILLSGKELEDRLKRIPKPHRTKLEDLSKSSKHLLFFICDLISVIYPATLPLIVSYLEQISPSVASSRINVPTLVGLAIAMGLLRPMEVKSGAHIGTYYIPTDLVDASHPFHQSPFLYLESQRAAYTSVLMTFPEGEGAYGGRGRRQMLIERMALGLGLQPKFIRTFARGASHSYKTYSIKKRNGDKRYIDHPSKQLKSLQRWLLEYVLCAFPVHPAAMAYQKGKSIFDNASAHASSKYLMRMDFANFFPSITADDLHAYKAGSPAVFAGWTDDDLDIVCMIVFRNSRLTIGAPTSPAISNALCFDMDTAITSLSGKRGVKYTRYADDLFFSTIERDILRPLQSDVERLIARQTLPAHLTINGKKTRHSSRRGSRRVTGIVIGSDRKPHVGRDLKRLIRAMVHRVDSLDPSARARLSGLLGYAVGFDKKFLNRLVIKYGNDLVEKAIHPDL